MKNNEHYERGGYQVTDMLPIPPNKPILVEQLNGEFSVQKSHKELLNNDVYLEQTRMVWLIVE